MPATSESPDQAVAGTSGGIGAGGVLFGNVDGIPTTNPTSLFWNNALNVLKADKAQFKGSPWFDVKSFGAIGDGVTDDTAAVQAAFAAAQASAVSLGISGWLGAGASIFFPPGKYLINTASASCLVATVGAYRGVNIIGAGYLDSIILISGTHSFIQNTNSLGFMAFENIGFIGQTGNEILMSMSSTGTAQNILRKFVYTRNLARLYDISGSGNADQCAHFGCYDEHLSTTSSFYVINNPQSVDHFWSGCHANTNYRFFEVEAGGVINWHGGSILVGQDYFLYLNDTGGSGIGTLNGKFTFTAVKVELQNANGGLVNNNSLASIVFSNSLLATRTGDPIGFLLTKQGKLDIDNCDLDYKINTITDNTSYAATNPPIVNVHNCKLIRPAYTLFVDGHSGANVGGRAKVEFVNCTYPQGIGTFPTVSIESADWSGNYKTGFSSQARYEKVQCFQGLPDGRGLPDSSEVVTFSLPQKCLVTKIMIVNSTSAASSWQVIGPSGAVWITSLPGQKTNVAIVNEEINSTQTFTLTNLTDNVLYDGYVLVWYI